MTRRPTPAALVLGPPCAACGVSEHGVTACTTPEAARLLDLADLPMSAAKVRARISLRKNSKLRES